MLVNTTALALRPGWWLVFWGLLTSLSLNWVLPVFDHHAAEYSPFHGHQWVGAASTNQRQRLLVDHAHGTGQRHVHTPDGAVAAMAGKPAIVGYSVLDTLLAVAASAGDIVVATDWPLVQPPLALWLAVGASAYILLTRTSPPPAQPPRSL